jgi:hypothetical protein
VSSSSHCFILLSLFFFASVLRGGSSQLRESSLALVPPALFLCLASLFYCFNIPNECRCIKSDSKLFSFVSRAASRLHSRSCLFNVFLLASPFAIENRIGQNLGNVISQILLCKQITPDFQLEELGSITKDSKEIARVLGELQEFMPKQEAYLGKV